MLRILSADSEVIESSGVSKSLNRKVAVIPKKHANDIRPHLTDGVKITGLQWFFLRSKNPVYFAIHIPRTVTAEEFDELVSWTLVQVPALANIYERKTEMFRAESPAEISETSEYQKVPSLSESWKNFLHGLPDLAENLDGRMFQASCFVSQKKTNSLNANGESLIIFAALHAAIEGVDLANLLRGKLDGEKTLQQKQAADISGTGLSNVFYTLTGMMIVASSHILSRARRRPALIPTTQHISLQRRGLQKMAREYGVTQKALLFAFARHSINQIEPPTYGIGIGKRASVTYTEHARATQLQDDQAIKMRLRADMLSVNGDVKELAERFDAMFLRKHKKPYFFQRINNSAIRINRVIERILPSLYGQKMFDYLPFSECYTLLPPNRFRAHLGDLRDGTIMTGSMSRGLDVITFSPGKEHIHIAFKTEPARSVVAQNCLDALGQHGLLAERVALER